MSLSVGQFLQPQMILAPLIMLYVRMWDLEDEEVLFNIRCLYGLSQSIVFGVLLYIRCVPPTLPPPLPLHSEPSLTYPSATCEDADLVGRRE